MRDGTGELTLGVEHDTVRAGAAAGVNLERVEDGELLVRPAGAEAKALAVVKGVGVVVAAFCIG